jgi:hypothetical protein
MLLCFHQELCCGLDEFSETTRTVR